MSEKKKVGRPRKNKDSLRKPVCISMSAEMIEAIEFGRLLYGGYAKHDLTRSDAIEILLRHQGWLR